MTVKPLLQRVLVIVVPALVLGACALAPYSLVAPGTVVVDDLTVQAGSGWNKAPGHQRVYARPNSEAWTRDGLLLDRLVIVPGVPDGDALFRAREETIAMPVFRADMLPNELEELVESSIVKFFGEGQAAVSTSNLRPQRFGEQRGVMFDLSATVTDAPAYRGMVGAFIVEERLYVLFFLGVTPHYYDKHVADAEAIIKSARI